jgi:phosphatidate phosphatase APP1
MSDRIVLIGSDEPIGIVAYHGFGNARRVLVQGRVMRSPGIGKSAATDSMFRNLLNTYRRARAHPAPHARVEVAIGHTRTNITADEEGFFRAWIDVNPPLQVKTAWVEATLRLVDPPQADEVSCNALLRIPTADAAFGVISDLDDTVIQSRVSNFVLAARTIMLGNARTRLPFAGVAALYQALEKGGDGKRLNPFYYVSSSPWNIHDLITEFLQLQAIPEGPVCLRDWDVGLDALTSSRLRQHKEPIIREIMDATDPLPFILIGDSSQKDPEIYAEIVRSYPGRVLAVYIRNVDSNPERSASIQKLSAEILKEGSSLVLADDSFAAAKHAAEKGWIHPAALDGIREEKKADESGKVDPQAPTVVVE